MIKEFRDLIDSMIPVGKVVKPHGLRGEVKMKRLTNQPKVFETLKRVLLYDEKAGTVVRAEIDTIRHAGKGYIVRFKGFKNVEAAERIRGFYVYAPLNVLPSLKEGEYYFYQLLNCEVYDPEGEYIGKVTDIIETGANDVIVVTKELPDFTVEEELIPVIKDCIVEFRFKDKKIVAKRLEYLTLEGKEDNDDENQRIDDIP